MSSTTNPCNNRVYPEHCHVDSCDSHKLLDGYSAMLVPEPPIHMDLICRVLNLWIGWVEGMDSSLSTAMVGPHRRA